MTETVTAFLTTKNSLYLLFLTIVAIVTPFLNVMYYGSTQKGILGFTWMPSFMYAIIIPFGYCSLGLLLNFAASKIEGDYKPIIKNISYPIIFIGLFYNLYTFIPLSADLPAKYYYWVMLGCSVGLFAIVIQLHRNIISERNYKLIIKDTIRYIYKYKDDIKEEKQEFHKIKRGELINETLENVES